MIFLDILLGICYTGMGIALMGLGRNSAVHRYRSRLLDTLAEAAYEDLHNKVKDWHWRFDVFNSASYNMMVIKFWKPLDSFYPDKAFLLSSVKNNKNKKEK